MYSSSDDKRHEGFDEHYRSAEHGGNIVQQAGHAELDGHGHTRPAYTDPEHGQRGGEKYSDRGGEEYVKENGGEYYEKDREEDEPADAERHMKADDSRHHGGDATEVTCTFYRSIT